MRGVPLNQRIRRVLSVSLDAGNALTFDTDPSVYFPAHVAQPSGENATSDISPRQARATATLWLGPRPPVVFHPSDRIEAAGATYELLSAPREVTEGRSTVGYRALVLLIGELYPRAAFVHALGDDDPAGEIQCSLFSLAHRNASRGDYQDSFAEAPAGALELLSAGNHELRFNGGEQWKITDAALSREVPFVAMTLRKVS
jgi:hypothetical protein